MILLMINYQSVEWIEPRLNLSQDLWGPSNVESDEDLVPGGYLFIIGQKMLSFVRGVNICSLLAKSGGQTYLYQVAIFIQYWLKIFVLGGHPNSLLAQNLCNRCQYLFIIGQAA